MKRTYLPSLAPGLVGLGAGVLITSPLWGNSPLTSPYTTTYETLREFQLWRGALIVQVSVFVSIAAYLLDIANDSWLPRLSPRETWGIGLATIAAIGLPNVTFVQVRVFPFGSQGIRLLLVAGLGVGAMVLLTNRLARIHAGFGVTNSPDQHRGLRHATQDLLVIAGTAITLATLGAGILQSSMDALQTKTLALEELSEYSAPLNPGHVLAYGGYFAALLLLFFAPVYGAERDSATRIRDGLSATDRDELVALDLDSSVVQRLVAAFGVLSPLLGALAAQLPFF